jgi:hypothetical protein
MARARSVWQDSGQQDRRQSACRPPTNLFFAQKKRKEKNKLQLLNDIFSAATQLEKYLKYFKKKNERCLGNLGHLVGAGGQTRISVASLGHFLLKSDGRLWRRIC